jgi:hypothetical protein
MRSNRLTRRRGLTLFEMAISLAVFITVTALSAPLLTNITSFYTESIFRSNLMEVAKISQERLVDELTSARVKSIDASGVLPVLTVVVPVPMFNGTSVDYLDASGATNWGVMEASGAKLDTPADPHRLTITPTVSGTIKESEVALDLDHDGKLDGTFQIGSLVLRTTGGMTKSLGSDRLVLSKVGVGAFDIDGDGVVDPLFQLSSEPFTDDDKDGIYDNGETFTDTNLNGYWDGALNMNFLAFATDRQGHGHSFVYRARVRLLGN